MQVINNIGSLDDLQQGAVVALGNFDGVHLGHREIFRALVGRARALGVKSLVYTFEPHPLKVLAPERAPLLLNSIEEKIRLIAASNVDILALIPFSAELASYPAEDFVKQVLVAQLQVRALVVGYDFAFGRGRTGTSDFLCQQGQRYGFDVEVLQPVGADGHPYSSTRVRALLAAGRVAEVPLQLGRHYTLAGQVVAGEKRGRTIGFPTANISTSKEQLPAPGVYAVIVRLGSCEYQGLVNVGCCPTFGPGKSTLEVYLLDFKGDIYGQELRLYFVERLREEQTFAGPDELIAAIAQDVAKGRRLLAGAKIIQYQEYLADGP